MPPKPLNYSKRIFTLITGIGRGIGRAATLELGNRLTSGSKIAAISNTTNIPEKIALSNEMKSRNPEVYFDVHMKNLAIVDIGEYISIIDKFVTHPSVKSNHYDYGLIIHNAGTLGKIEHAVKLQNINEWRSYLDLNFFSPTLLNSIFITKCKPYMEHIFVVNISSIYSVLPQAQLSMYCSVKAARNAYFGALAKEEANMSVMNYSPGPVATHQLNELHQKNPLLKDTAKIVSPDQTVCKMFDILSSGNYTSGVLCDYYGRT